MSDTHAITTLEELETLYGTVNPHSLAKETTHLTAEYRQWIERAPFLALASSGPGGLDCTPRGDAEGHALRVLNATRLAIPDRRGNNRLDTLRNIVADPRVALLFMIPGVNETLRINGRATITKDPALIDSFTIDGKKPASVILVDIDAVYFQCARALARARLWEPHAHGDKPDVPTGGQMLKGAASDFDSKAYDAGRLGGQKASLY